LWNSNRPRKMWCILSICIRLMFSELKGRVQQS
jgi:hypothetical protein